MLVDVAKCGANFGRVDGICSTKATDGERKLEASTKLLEDDRIFLAFDSSVGSEVSVNFGGPLAL